MFETGEHTECYIGTIHDEVVTLKDAEVDAKYLVANNPALNCTYKDMMRNMLDCRKKSVSLRRFRFCPVCGKEIDFEGMRRIYAE